MLGRAPCVHEVGEQVVPAVLTAAFAWRVAKFVHSTGELRELVDVLARTGRCKRVHADFHGYEDFAVFEDGGIVVFASDHAHFAFNFGTSMRQAIAAKEPKPPHVRRPLP